MSRYTETQQKLTLTVRKERLNFKCSPNGFCRSQNCIIILRKKKISLKIYWNSSNTLRIKLIKTRCDKYRRDMESEICSKTEVTTTWEKNIFRS